MTDEKDTKTATGSESGPGSGTGPSSSIVSSGPGGSAETIPEGEALHTFSENVDVFEAIMNSDNVGDPVTDTWRWVRKGIDVPIRSLEPDEFEDITKRHTVRRRVSARSREFQSELDVSDYNADIVATACLNPNFQDPEIRNSLAGKVTKPTEKNDLLLVKNIWLPGEVASMTMAILELTGFNEDEEIIKNLKGSSSGGKS